MTGKFSQEIIELIKTNLEDKTQENFTALVNCICNAVINDDSWLIGGKIEQDEERAIFRKMVIPSASGGLEYCVFLDEEDSLPFDVNDVMDIPSGQVFDDFLCDSSFTFLTFITAAGNYSIPRDFVQTMFEAIEKARGDGLGDGETDAYRFVEQAIMKAEVCLEQNLTDEAYAVLKETVDIIEQLPIIKHKNAYDFEEAFEEFLYREVNQITADFEKIPFRLVRVYCLYASVLIKKEMFLVAHTAVLRALEHNPVSTALLFLSCEISRHLGDEESYIKSAAEAFKYSYNCRDIAKCYRNLSVWFAAKKKYDYAYSACVNSLVYIDDKNAELMLEKIVSMNGGKEPKIPSESKFEKTLTGLGFSPHVTETVQGIAFAYGTNFKNEGEYNGARYCFEILYGLTEAPEIRILLDSLPKE